MNYREKASELRKYERLFFKERMKRFHFNSVDDVRRRFYMIVDESLNEKLYFGDESENAKFEGIFSKI